MCAAHGWSSTASARRQKLVVELDGYETHGTRAAFARDRRRDRLLEAAGFTVIRVTSWDLDPGEHRAALERDLHLLLQRADACSRYCGA